MGGVAAHPQTRESKRGPTSLHLLVVAPGNPLGLFGTEGLRERHLAVFFRACGTGVSIGSLSSES